MSGEDRDFLFSSLEDLEREYAAGDLDDADYEALKSSYVKRLADVLRGTEIIEDIAENTNIVPTRNRKKIVLSIAAVLFVAVGLGVLVARQSGQRLPGQTLSGGTPNSTAGLLAQARQLNFSDPIAAIKIYSEVLKTRPDEVEALTYRSWLLALTAREASDDIRTAAVQAAIVGLGRATLIDPDYPDAHCFLGIVSYRFAADTTTAKTELKKCQDANPPAEVQTFVDSIVAEVNATK
ncbi:unannotated protein [freshwater metagenome]|jgi:hypothetical protein|uniref:Unannotated protein n=1 Tax=freshwater metagenome TaxID=449393 RepID=A0A6J7RC98_9ZZZZ|nr:hypothetical protein [Actinomycetota bacterium]